MQKSVAEGRAESICPDG